MSAIATIEIAAPGGARARILSYGARLQSLTAPDRDGVFDMIVLGFPDPQAYRRDSAFIGGVVGRYANRIGGSRFPLDGRSVALALNDGPNHLHGGPIGFDRRDWYVAAHDDRSVTLDLVSDDGDQGYPGRLAVRTRYAFEDDGALCVDLTATTDAPTIVNLSHHAYFNLAGEHRASTIADHWLRLSADRYTPVDGAAIPMGPLLPVAGTPFDFRSPRRIAAGWSVDHPQLASMQGYDHNMVHAPADGTLRQVATLFDPGSGRVLDLATAAPGLQLYSGNVLSSVDAGHRGVCYEPRDGLCLEPQLFPDSPNRAAFPSARLDPGEAYRQAIRLSFRTAAGLDEAFQS